ncbi:hypothetical protein TeGR_g7397 [Tetraparma gracilis]|uniref:Enoyl reductase (ER) domain-containing protein n=1 Tax=Tetraparma gracilis TaxID=2962635 RepID=A0ABQ6M7J2_9STRA|nr:hypothetical protein TeGR_g7397 [Tetraparma gracilis]
MLPRSPVSLGLASLSVLASSALFSLLSSFLASPDGAVLKNQLLAVSSTVSNWARYTLLKRSPPARRIPPGAETCVQIVSPGGVETLQIVPLPPNTTAVGYNVVRGTPFLARSAPPAAPCVTVAVTHFALNFADVCVRLGLYESAIRYVGYPIVPGFDVAGTILKAPAGSGFSEGERVYGATLFGGYSSLLSVPANQIRRVPPSLSLREAASLPAVSFTALHALTIGGFPARGKYEHLAQCGRLVVYGFHSNMPVGRAALSPLSWIKMAVDMFRMPTVDYMGLTLDSRAVLGFNLSFFEEETELIGSYFESIDGWIREGKIAMPKTELFGMGEVGKAHERLQSGASEGKMVIEVGR